MEVKWLQAPPALQNGTSIYANYGSFMEVNAPWNTWGTFQNDLDDTRLTPAIFPAEPLIFWSAIPLANCPDEMRLTNTVSRRNIFCDSGAVDCSNGVESLLV